MKSSNIVLAGILIQVFLWLASLGVSIAIIVLVIRALWKYINS